MSALHDIVEPGRVSVWPWAMGWWIVLAVLAVGLVFVGGKFWLKRLHNVYRKEALKALAQAESPAEVVAVLRRCVRVWRSAPELSGLSQAEWFSLLAVTGKTPLPEALKANWDQALYGSLPVEDLPQWKSFAETWVRNHQPEGADD
ncbi:DUF4381 domain-containing protein [Kiritimatiellaeota bacterium B1221]|nr:DUF4381 domain-containing protein [Kiritimatiellaeota bacterium B1221]